MSDLLGIYANPAEVIFKKLYSVRVPIISTYSEHELEIVGIPMNQIDGKNKNSYNELTTVMITINDMVDKFSNGFKIMVSNEKDVLHIYNIIQKHLGAWKNYSVTSLNQAHNDLDEDLIILDKFSNEIFDINKRKIIDSNVIKTPAFGNSFSDLLMTTGPKPKKQEIDYENATRDNLAPEAVRHSKYDLNSLLN